MREDASELSSAPGTEAYEVLVVRYGTRSTTRSKVFLNYDVYGEPDGPIEMDYFVWVIRNKRRTIFVDTGFSNYGGTSRGRKMLVDPLRAWKTLELDGGPSPTIVLTHAHYDHIGNIARLPSAHLVIARRELEFWTERYGRLPLFEHSGDPDEIADLVRAEHEGRLALFDESSVVAPGIEIIRVGGHTPGLSVVRVWTTAGWVLLASDAVHYDEELARDMPFTQVADVVGMYDALETIRGWQTSGAVQHIVAGHDPGTLQRLGRRVKEDVEFASIGTVD